MRREGDACFLVLRPTVVIVFVLAFVVLGGRPANAASDLHLPFPNGVTRQVTTTPGILSHGAQPNYYAYDFGMPVGATVSAAHSGTVIRYFLSSTIGGCNAAYAPYANYLILDHGNGESGVYYHFQANSGQVAPGQFVYQGHPLAGAGNSGYSCGSHLHFMDETTPPDGTKITASVPVSFLEAPAPALGSWVTSQNRKRFSAAYVSGSAWLTLARGQTYTAVARWVNAGWDTWRIDEPGRQAYLGTSGAEPGQDQQSALGGASVCLDTTDWLKCNRIRPTTDGVDPDQTAWFVFTLRGPSNGGTHRLYLRPVIEGVQWLEDYGVFWQVTTP